MRTWPTNSSASPSGPRRPIGSPTPAGAVEEKLIVWTLLDTGLRVSELCSLTLDNVQWQQRALRVTGKGGPTARGANNGSSRCPRGSARSWNRISP